MYTYTHTYTSTRSHPPPRRRGAPRPENTYCIITLYILFFEKSLKRKPLYMVSGWGANFNLSPSLSHVKLLLFLLLLFVLLLS